MAGGTLVERLRHYLDNLHPDTRAMLMVELQRRLLRGEDMPGGELVLRELRRDSRAKRPGNLARLFFQPLEPFLVDDIATRDHPGRIARATLEPVWEWIGRDLMPGQAKAVGEQVAAAFECGDDARAGQLAAGFQDRAVKRMEMLLNAAAKDEKVRRRLSGQIGTRRALDDVAAVVALLRAQDLLAAFGSRLPNHIEALDDATIRDLLLLIESRAGGGPELFVYKLALTMSRLEFPWQLIRLATGAAGSRNASRVAESRYAVAVDIVFAEIERMIEELKSELRIGRTLATGALLKSIHDAARGIHAEIDLTDDRLWSLRLAVLRQQLSDLLSGEIEGLNDRVQRLLRPRPDSDIAPNSTVDPDDVEETESLIEFVDGCRAYAGGLAVDEITARTWSELEQYLDTTATAMVENLRNAGLADHSFQKSQFDAAMRFCTRVFGEKYAQTLANARDFDSGAERKVAAKA